MSDAQYRVGVLLLSVVTMLVAAHCRTVRAAAARPSARAAQMVSTAMRRFVADLDSTEATASLNQALSESPDYAPALFDLAVVAEADSRWDDAARYLHGYLRTRAPAMARRASAELVRLKLIAVQERTADGRATRLYNEQVEHARLLVDLGMPREAIGKAMSAVRLSKKPWLAYAVVAEALMRVKHYRQACEILRRATELAPPERRSALAKSVEDCHKEVRYQELITGARVLSETRNYTKAADAYREAWAIIPDRDSAGIAFAINSAMAGNFKVAGEAFEVLRSSPDPMVSREARSGLAKLELRHLVTPMPNDADSAAATGLQEVADGNLTAAAEAYRAAAHAEPGNSLWHAQLASVDARLRDWVEATTEYRRAYLLNPADRQSLDNLGATLLQQRRYREAIETYSMEVQKDPKSALAYDRFGTSLFLGGRPVQAAAAFKQAVALEPDSGIYRAHFKEASNRTAVK